MLRIGDLEIRLGSREVRRGGEVIPLRPMELKLLIALARRGGAVASRAELLREVWGYSEETSSRTVDSHIAELRRKLEPDPANPCYLLTVARVGYRAALERRAGDG